MTPQAGQDLFNHLQQLLFGPPGQNTQQIQQQYQQLIQAYDQHQSQGQITGRPPAASVTPCRPSALPWAPSRSLNLAGA